MPPALALRRAAAHDPDATPARRAGALYACLATGDLRGVLDALAPDVAWDHDPGLGPLPVTRVILGRDAVAAMLAGSEGRDLGGGEVLRVTGCGDDAAALVAGGPAGRLELHLWTFAPDGRVASLCRLRVRPDDLN